jgi:hypothetical protein
MLSTYVSPLETFWTMRPIYLKFGVDLMPLKGTQSQAFLTSYNHY